MPSIFCRPSIRRCTSAHLVSVRGRPIEPAASSCRRHRDRSPARSAACRPRSGAAAAPRSSRRRSHGRSSTRRHERRHGVEKFGPAPTTRRCRWVHRPWWPAKGVEIDAEGRQVERPVRCALGAVEHHLGADRLGRVTTACTSSSAPVTLEIWASEIKLGARRQQARQRGEVDAAVDA